MNAKEIISVFGGVRPLARLLGDSATTVQNWKTRKSIPAKHQQRILEVGLKNGFAISPSDFFDLPMISQKPKTRSKKNGK